MSILAPSITNLWQVIEACGIDPAPLFAEEGIEVVLPIEPGTRLPYDSVDRVRAKAASLAGDESLGLRTARFVHPSQIGALGYAWLASSSLRTALMRLHRYVRVLNEKGHVEISDDDEKLKVVLNFENDSANMTVRDDSQLAFLVTLSRLNLGPDFDPLEIDFKHPEPADTKPYQKLFRCPVRFGQAENSMTVSLEDADRVLPGANPILAQMNDRVATRRLAQLDVNDIPNRVRDEVMEQLPNGNVTDESIAEALHMTSRTLNRRLKAEDESFRSLLNEVREDLATQYISDPSLTLTEITFLLGFAEASSFSRAYRRWTGSSPSEVRQSP